MRYKNFNKKKALVDAFNKNFGATKRSEIAVALGLTEEKLNNLYQKGCSNIDTYIDICNHVDCDINFLLGYDSYVDLDKSSINRTTGLSEQSIDLLNNLVEDKYLIDSESTLSFINHFIENSVDGFESFLFRFRNLKFYYERKAIVDKYPIIKDILLECTSFDDNGVFHYDKNEFKKQLSDELYSKCIPSKRELMETLEYLDSIEFPGFVLDSEKDLNAEKYAIAMDFNKLLDSWLEKECEVKK